MDEIPKKPKEFEGYVFFHQIGPKPSEENENELVIIYLYEPIEFIKTDKKDETANESKTDEKDEKINESKMSENKNTMPKTAMASTSLVTMAVSALGAVSLRKRNK